MFSKVIAALTVLVIIGAESALLSSRVTRHNAKKVIEIDSDVFQLRVYMTKKSYPEAQEECQSAGGFLVLDTAVKQNEITRDIEEAAKNLRYYEQRALLKTSYWIGGKYDQDHWKWQSGETIPLKGSNQQWYKGQPNRPGDDCVYMMRKKSFLKKQAAEKWFDGNCQRKRYFICEINSNEQLDVAEDGSASVETPKQLEFVHQADVFDTAYFNCRRNGGNLLRIDSESKFQQVLEQLRDSYRLFTGSLKTEARHFWIKDASGYIPSLGGDLELTEPCKFITVRSHPKFSTLNISVVATSKCSEKKSSICERDINQDEDSIPPSESLADETEDVPPTEAPFVMSGIDEDEEWMLIVHCPKGGDCYVTPQLKSNIEDSAFEIVFHRKKKTFQAASEHCEETSGHLVVLGPHLIRASVTDHILEAEPMISKLLEKSDHGFWVGAAYNEEREIWSWIDGKQVEDANNWWYHEEPKRNASGECMFVRSGMSTSYGQQARGKWFGGSCYTERFYACQKSIQGAEKQETHVIDGFHDDWIFTVKCDGSICSLTPIIKHEDFPK